MIVDIESRYTLAMISKFQRILFYPVLMVATILALQSWTYQPVWFGCAALAVVGVMWLSPFAGRIAELLRTLLFWSTLCVLLLGVLWIYAWSRQ